MVIDLEEAAAIDLDAGIATWQNSPASKIAHHGAACCDISREWIIGTDFSQLHAGNALTGPRWLRKNFKWGPSKWPLHWCEAVREKTLDCGALAALSHELFLARGVRSFPAQFILQFNDVSTRHWRETWNAAGSCAPWLSEGLIYHEGCAVVVGEEEIKLWDATATWWINPKQFGGYAALLATRVFNAQSAAAKTFTWGPHRLVANTWQKVKHTRVGSAGPTSAHKCRSKPRVRRSAKTKVEADTIV